MNIGIPRERAADENRVGLSPAGVHHLIQQGHQVVIERGAGLGSGFSDEQYAEAGALVVHACDEVYGRSGLVVKVLPPMPEEYDCIGTGQIVMAAMHLAVAGPDLVNLFIERKCTAIDYVTMQDLAGGLPVLRPMSQIAGRIVPQLAARYLQCDHGGAGILLGGAPAVPPAEVVIIGGGVVGRNAARACLGVGARVTMLDADYDRLRRLDWMFEGRLTTFVASEYTLPKVLKYADVVIGCVLIPGARAPHLVTKDMVKLLRERSLIFDISIDQGGCFETSRPTRLSDPTYVVHGITHYCVPNLPSLVARSATYALGNITLPYVAALAGNDPASVFRNDITLQRGINIYRGKVVNPHVASAHGFSPAPIERLLAE
ncbi:MAG: alanine dehydrogenase [bacterium]